LVIGIFTDIVVVFVALMFLSTAELMKSGSGAFAMDNVPREKSGFAFSLSTAGRSFGIITLLIFGAMLPLIEFGQAYRIAYVVISMFLFLATAIRAVSLTGGEKPAEQIEGHILKDFFVENGRTVKLLLGVMPGIIAVMILDSISDGIFKFGALIYTNETLNVSFVGINVIFLFTLLIQVPLLLKVGRFIDRMGIEKASLMVYSIMPICAFLLFISQDFLYWAPATLVQDANQIFDGLGVIFSTPFIAIVMKYVNDSLWGLVLYTLIQKKLPQKDTAKILAVFTTIIYLCGSIGPLIGGLIFEYVQQSWLFLVVLVLNLIILLTIAGTRFVKDESEIVVE
ncbi:MAG: hypothetical protein RTU30_14745, partial [Candidatus Thorarchaeota archaeon]